MDSYSSSVDIIPQGPEEQSFNPIALAKKKAIADKARAGVVQNLPATLPAAMKQLHSKLQTNDIGLPIYIYRTDMVPSNLFTSAVSDEERLEIMETSSVALDYSEGYPTQANGMAFWAKLDFETREAFQAFDEYRMLTAAKNEEGQHIAPVRTLSALSQAINVPVDQLRNWSYMYYWTFRAKAYDMFMVASYQKQREHRAMVAEDNHYRKAGNWISKLEKIAEEMLADDDWIAEMKPKEVLDLIERFVKLQRISVGLPANGVTGLDKSEAPKNASLEIAIRQVAKAAGEQARAGSDDEEATVATLLENPEDLNALQELIIRAGSGGR